MFGVFPYMTVAGPSDTTCFATVSLTATAKVRVAPVTCPLSWAGIVGPNATGYAWIMKLPLTANRPFTSSVT